MVVDLKNEIKKYSLYFWIVAAISTIILVLGSSLPEFSSIVNLVVLSLNLVNMIIRMIFIGKLNMYFAESYSSFVSILLACICFMPLLGEIIFLIADRYKLGKVP